MKQYQISEKLLCDLFYYFLLEDRTVKREERIIDALNEKHDAMMRRAQYLEKKTQA